MDFKSIVGFLDLNRRAAQLKEEETIDKEFKDPKFNDCSAVRKYYELRREINRQQFVKIEDTPFYKKPQALNENFDEVDKDQHEIKKIQSQCTPCNELWNYLKKFNVYK